MTAVPEYPPGRNLLDGRIVVVTAAAGAGIGFAAARRCVEEGATVVISDVHERRLGEAADVLADLTGQRPVAVRCDVTVEDDVQGLFAAAIDAPGHVDVLVNNAGLGGETPLVFGMPLWGAGSTGVSFLISCLAAWAAFHTWPSDDDEAEGDS